MFLKFRLGSPALIFVLFGLALLPFLSVLHFGFLNFDDGIHVYQNAWLLPVRWQSFLTFLTHPLNGLYVPVTYSAWGITALLSQHFRGSSFDPLAFHAVNLFFHSVNAVLVFLLLRRWALPLFGAALGALFFAWHPLHVEPVAWISGLKDVLSGFFVLLSLLCYGTQSGLGPQVVWEPKKWLSLLFFVLALGAKPSAVVVAPVLFCLEVLVFRLNGLQAFKRTSIFWTVAVLSILYSKTGQPDSILSWRPSLIERPLIALDTVGFYLEKLLFPFSLSLNYGRTPESVLARGFTLEALLAVSLLLMLVFAWGRSQKWRTGFVLPFSIFLLALLPTSGFVLYYYQRYSSVADRFAYLAVLGMALGFGKWFSNSSLNAGLRTALAGGILFLCLAISTKQVGHWKNDVALLRNMSQINSSAENHYNLALALTEELEGRIQAPLRRGEAPPKPKSGEVRQRLLHEIEQQYLLAIDANPSYFSAYNNLGILKAGQGEWKLAEFYYTKALTLSPDEPDTYNNLGVSLAARGEIESARVYFEKTLSLRPQYGEAHFNLGLIFETKNLWREAHRAFGEAVRCHPTIPRFREHLALASAKLKQSSAGVEP